MDTNSAGDNKESKSLEKNSRFEKHLKGEPVTDHPLALPVPDSNQLSKTSGGTSSLTSNDCSKSPESAVTSGNIGITPSLSSLDESKLAQ